MANPHRRTATAPLRDRKSLLAGVLHVKVELNPLSIFSVDFCHLWSLLS